MTSLQPYEDFVKDVRIMRETVAASARAEPDRMSYNAYLLQARSLKLIEEQYTSLRHEAYRQTQREGYSDEFHTELRYVELLSNCLSDHVAKTREIAESEGHLQDVSTRRLAAARHHGMISDFVQRYVIALDTRAAEMSAEEASFHRMTFERPSAP